MSVGTEWLIEASGCDPKALADEAALRRLFDSIISDLGLKSVGSLWHKFPNQGGVTALVALTESHLACHTWPEAGTATFNLFCCRERPEWNWRDNLSREIGAKVVTVTRFERGVAASTIAEESSAAGGPR
jgi:S-adenosylmethionine decarboxylase